MADSDSRTGTAPLSALEPIRAGLARPWRRLPGRNFTKADVLLYRLDGIEVAVKDYGPRPLVVRHTLARLLLGREIHAYRAAEGLPGLPRYLGRLGPFRLALERVDGEPLADLRATPRDDALFDRLAGLIDALHARGIALGDLHHRDVLVGADGSVRIVDLATAWIAGEGAGRVRRAVFRRLAELDRVAVARMRARWTGGDIDAAPGTVSRSAAAWHARGRRIKSAVNRLRGRGRH
jgi:hypothetical protein